MSIAGVEELRDKVVLRGQSLFGMSGIMSYWGMRVVGDSYEPSMPLLERFHDSKADVAIYSVVDEEEGRKILVLPQNIRQKFVVFKNSHGLAYSHIAGVYKEIEEAKIPSIWENTDQFNSEFFATTLLKALGSTF